MRSGFTWIWILSLFPLSAHGQSIINTSAISHDLDSALSVVVDAGGDFSFGNSNIQDLSVNFGVGKSLTEDASLWLIGGGNRLISDRDVLQSQSYVHVRLNYEIMDSWTLNGYAQTQTNSVLEIRNRTILGGNIELDFNPDHTLSAAIGGFAELERYTVDAMSQKLRGNLILVGEESLNKTELVGFLYMQPALNNFHDFRMIGEFSLRTAITSSLQFAVNGVIRFDNEPHQSLSRTDMGITTSVRYEFHKK